MKSLLTRPAPEHEDRFYTLEETSVLTRLAPGPLRALVRAGKIKPVHEYPPEFELRTILEFLSRYSNLAEKLEAIIAEFSTKADKTISRMLR